MGYQITSKVLVGMGREDDATELMTDEVWGELVRRTDIVRLARERGLVWPELELGGKEQAEIPQALADTLAYALEEMFLRQDFRQDIRDRLGEGTAVPEYSARRIIDILRAGGVILARIAPPLAGDDPPPIR
jgi:hypothetical protein